MIEWDPEAEKVRNLHSVENPAACKRIGGRWEKSACIIDERGDPYMDVGVTAPIKGAYFWYEVNCYDQDGFPSERCHANIIGCQVKDSEDYPHSPGWCNAFYSKFIHDQKFLTDKTHDYMINLATDVLKGKAKRHGLGYFTHDGKRLAGPTLNSFVGDIDGDIFKHIGKYVKPFRIRRRHT